MAMPTDIELSAVAKNVNNILKFAFNLKYAAFKALWYEMTQDDYLSEEEYTERFASMRDNFTQFFCNLDHDEQVIFVREAFNNYGFDRN